MTKKPDPDRACDKPLQVRLTDEQQELFRRAADANGRSVGSWARDRLEKAAALELKGGKTA